MALDQLELPVAVTLAKTLKTVPGFSWDEENINATAGDLVSWCVGAIVNNELWPAEAQARWLVGEARRNWDKWMSTAGLYSLFRARFNPPPEQRPFDSGLTPEQKAELRAQYGPPDPAFKEKLLAVPTLAEHKGMRKAVLWQAVRDSVYYTEGPGKIELDNKLGREERSASRAFWRQAMDKHNRDHAADIAAFRLELEQHGWDELMKFDWTKTVTSEGEPQRKIEGPAPRLITQADIDAARAKRNEEPKP